MFKSKQVREYTLKRLMDEAIDNEDWELVKELRSIEKEQDQQLFEERLNGLLMGYGAAITCVIIGGIVTKIIISRTKKITNEG